MNRTKTAVTGIMLLLLTQAWSWGLSLIEVAIVPRYLGPSNLGKVALASSVLSIAALVVTFGGASQIVRTIASRPETAERTLTAVLTFRTLVGVPVILIVWLLMALWVPDRLVVVLTGMIGLNVYLTWVLEAFFAYRQAQARFTTFARAEMSAQTVSVFVKVLLVIKNFGAVGAVLGETVRSVVGLFSVWFSRKGNIRLARITAEDMKRLVREGVPYFQASICGWLYGAASTPYLIYVFSGSNDANGWFSVAQRLLGLLFVLPSVTVNVLMPLLTRVYEQSPDEFRSLARRSVNPLLVLSIPFALMFLLRADAIVFALGLYTKGFASVPILLQISGAGLLLRWASMSYGMLLVCSNRIRGQARATLYAAPFNILATAGLVVLTHQGYHNAAIGATIAAELTELLIVVIYIRYLQDPDLIKANLAAIGRGLIAGIPPAVLLWYLPMPNRWAFLGITALSLAVFIPAAVRTGAIRRDEIEPILSLIRARVRRSE